MEYTKGEWKAYKDDLTKNAYHIEVVHTGHEKLYTEVAYAYSKADAHLISAAPDMYEALKAYVDNALIQDPCLLPLFIQMKHAIAKADRRE